MKASWRSHDTGEKKNLILLELTQIRKERDQQTKKPLVKKVCNFIDCQFQWPHDLRRRSVAAGLLGLLVRILSGAQNVCLVSVAGCQVKEPATGESLIQKLFVNFKIKYLQLCLKGFSGEYLLEISYSKFIFVTSRVGSQIFNNLRELLRVSYYS